MPRASFSQSPRPLDGDLPGLEAELLEVLLAGGDTGPVRARIVAIETAAAHAASVASDAADAAEAALAESLAAGAAMRVAETCAILSRRLAALAPPNFPT